MYTAMLALLCGLCKLKLWSSCCCDEHFTQPPAPLLFGCKNSAAMNLSAHALSRRGGIPGCHLSESFENTGIYFHAQYQAQQQKVCKLLSFLFRMHSTSIFLGLAVRWPMLQARYCPTHGYNEKLSNSRFPIHIHNVFEPSPPTSSSHTKREMDLAGYHLLLTLTPTID